VSIEGSELEQEYQRHVAEATRLFNDCKLMLKNGIDPKSERYVCAYAQAEAERGLANQLDEWLNRLDTNAPIAEPMAIGTQRGRSVTATPDYARAFDAYLHRFRHSPDGFVDARELRVLTVASDPDGGYTVPEDRQGQLVRQLPAMSPLLALIRRPPTDRDSVVWVKVTPHGSSPDFYTSAFVGGMVGEITGGGDAQPQFGQIYIPIRKARAQVRLSMDLAADSEFDLNEFLITDGAMNIALVREAQVLTGTGVGNNCRGVLLDPEILALGGVDVSGTTADHVSNTVADLGSVPKLLDLHYSVPAQYRRSPSYRWVMNSDTARRIRGLVDGDGSLMLKKLSDELPEVVISEAMPSGGTNGNIVILAGDLSQIVSPERQTLAVQVLLEKYADTDEIAIILRSRFGVGILNPRAFRLGTV
jgi:HK97 family phage major capsid protein